MTPGNLRMKVVSQLEEELNSLLKAHFNLRMQKATQQLTRSCKLRKVRRDIARIKTAIAAKKG